MQWVKINQIRDNASQAAGWLILQGAKERDKYYDNGVWTRKKNLYVPMADRYYGWKAGSIEPTVGQHEDIEYLYTLDLREKVTQILGLADGTETVREYDLQGKPIIEDMPEE